MQKLLLDKRTGPLIQTLSNKQVFSKSLSHVFGRDTKPSQELLDIFWNALKYKDGNLKTHKIQQYVHERRVHRSRWVDGLVRAARHIPIKLINGPADPVSGRHMVERYREVMGRDVDISLLGEHIGHYPHVEDTATVYKHIVAFYGMHSI